MEKDQAKSDSAPNPNAESNAAVEGGAGRPSIFSNAGKRRDREASTDGWDYVYLKTEDNEVRLVELRDTQDRCSNVSTVLGLVGFTAPICLAVPSSLLSPGGAVPVVSGNVIELGEWDITAAEVMLPAPEYSDEGYTFFASNISSNYCEEDEVVFRFALVTTPMGETAYREIVCWEGQFLRRMSNYKAGPGAAGAGCLLFGHQEAVARETGELATLLHRQRQLSPGWVSDQGQAALILRLAAPQFSEPNKGLTLCPVDIRLSVASPELTLYRRSPLAQSLNGTFEIACSSSGSTAVLYPLGCKSIGYIEYVQLVPEKFGVPMAIEFRFNENKGVFLDATARLPMLTVAEDLPEEESLTCNVASASAEKSSAISASLTLTVRRIRFCSHCPDPSVLRSLDRCGQFIAPPPKLSRPIRIAHLPGAVELSLDGEPDSMQFFELPVSLSSDGTLRCQLVSAPTTVPPEAGLVARLVSSRSLKDSPVSAEAAADALLSALLSADLAWLMIASSDLHVCTALCLKQMRAPVAFVFTAAATMADPDTTVEALNTCRFYGVRAVIVGAVQATPAFAETVACRGLALYVYGGTPKSAEVFDALEGIFEQGTFADLLPSNPGGS